MAGSFVVHNLFKNWENIIGAKYLTILHADREVVGDSTVIVVVGMFLENSTNWEGGQTSAISGGYTNYGGLLSQRGGGSR